MFAFKALEVLLVLGLFVISTTCIEQNKSETLQLVQIIFRHGERTPIKTYPFDPYRRDSTWPQGWGQLTEKGKGQAFALGQYLRSRYKDFLSDNFISNEVNVMSSDWERTMMSGQLCLAGLYPTENGTEWNPSLNWQPVPIRTISKENRTFLATFKASCPRYEDKLGDVLVNSPPLKAVNEKNAKLFEFLSQASGSNVTNAGTLDFLDGILIESRLGMTIPEWAKFLINDPEIHYLLKLILISKTMTTDMKRIFAGPLIKIFVDNIQQKISQVPNNRKAFLFSGHDENIFGILDTLGVIDLELPTLSSALILELHKRQDKYFVQLLYRNDSTREPYKLKLGNCDFECPLNDFLNLTKPFIPGDWDTECNTDSVTNTIISYIKDKCAYFITFGTTFIVNNLATVGAYFAYTYFKSPAKADTGSGERRETDETITIEDDEKQPLLSKVGFSKQASATSSYS